MVLMTVAVGVAGEASPSGAGINTGASCVTPSASYTVEYLLLLLATQKG
jgi:hypothetical protein